MTSNVVLQQISNTNGIDMYSVLREIIQISFLEEIYKIDESKNLYFKGGTALKILFDSNRYSEDLDFTTNLSTIEVSKLVDKTVTQLQKEYPTIIVKDIESLAGISKKIFLPIDFAPMPMSIKLDFSQRENVIRPTFGTIFTKLPITTTSIINHLSDEEILAEKYRAIINRVKGRDLYDFLFLLKRGVKFDTDLVNEKLKFYNEKYNPQDFISKVSKWDEKELNEDIRRYLPLRDRDIIPQIKTLLLKKFEEIK